MWLSKLCGKEHYYQEYYQEVDPRQGLGLLRLINILHIWSPHIAITNQYENFQISATTWPAFNPGISVRQAPKWTTLHTTQILRMHGMRTKFSFPFPNFEWKVQLTVPKVCGRICSQADVYRYANFVSPQNVRQMRWQMGGTQIAEESRSVRWSNMPILM